MVWSAQLVSKLTGHVYWTYSTDNPPYEDANGGVFTFPDPMPACIDDCVLCMNATISVGASGRNQRWSEEVEGAEVFPELFGAQGGSWAQVGTDIFVVLNPPTATMSVP
jgi:hypothetical protein